MGNSAADIDESIDELTGKSVGDVVDDLTDDSVDDMEGSPVRRDLTMKSNRVCDISGVITHSLNHYEPDLLEIQDQRSDVDDLSR